MKTFSISTVLLIISFVLSGCATTNAPPSQQATSSLDAVQEQLNEITQQLGETENSLDNVTNASSGEIEDALNTFSDNASNVTEMRNELNERVEQMRAETKEYLSEWQSQAASYDNPQLRRGSEERRNEVNQALDDVVDDYGQVNRTLETYISDIEEIRSYLNNDPTTQGVEAVYSLSEEVDDTGEDLRQAISSMQRSISDAQQKMGSGPDNSSEE